jgi:hypothetical protein
MARKVCLLAFQGVWTAFHFVIVRYAKANNIEKMSDWYRVTTSDIDRAGGRPLLQAYGVSLCKLLQNVYTDYNWLPWKFQGVARGWWSDLGNLKQFIKYVEGMYLQCISSLFAYIHSTEYYGITRDTLDDWYIVGYGVFRRLGGATPLMMYGSLLSILKKIYPGT